MTHRQKKALFISLSLIFVLVGILIAYWCLIKFNPINWIIDNASWFIIILTLCVAGGLMILGYWLEHRKRL